MSAQLNVPREIPASDFRSERFLPDGGGEPRVQPEDLVYFLLNVGDGDTQLLLLPERRDGTRRAVVIDVATEGKLVPLVRALRGTALLRDVPDDDFLFPLVVNTHPHEDHIGGMPEFLREFGRLVREYWEPGYYHPSRSYLETMQILEDADPHIQQTQPTSGTTRFLGALKLQVLAPAVGLRTRFDTYGVDLNDASITLKAEFPASRVKEGRDGRDYVKLRGKTRTLLLGADALLASWGHVMVDYPELRPDDSPVAATLEKAIGPDALRAEVFKVPHHASKHGVTLGLVEVVNPTWSFVSSLGGGGKYNFPHLVAQEAVREALEPTTRSGAAHEDDHKLGIHYTAGRDSDDVALGSIALVVSPSGRKQELWRFGDEPRDEVDLGNARLYVGPRRKR